MTSTSSASTASAAAAQYLTFTLDHERYAVEISRVKEVLEFTTVSKVPRTPDFIRGMINLRGNIVPVIDLRLKLGLSATAPTVDTCIVITEIVVDGAPTLLGALADSVQEVLELDPGTIVPPPRMGTRIAVDFLRGISRQEDEFLLVLDIDKVMTEDDLRATVASTELAA